MSRRIRVNLTRKWCKLVGHKWLMPIKYCAICDRCGRAW